MPSLDLTSDGIILSRPYSKLLQKIEVKHQPAPDNAPYGSASAKLTAQCVGAKVQESKLWLPDRLQVQSPAVLTQSSKAQA